MKKVYWKVWSALALALCFYLVSLATPSGSAQTTYGSISGAVTDPSGAAIADAQVTLTNLDTTEKRVQGSGSDGLYSFVNLLPGRYLVDFEKAGFKRTSRPEVVVEVGQAVRIDIALQVSEFTQTV